MLTQTPSTELLRLRLARDRLARTQALIRDLEGQVGEDPAGREHEEANRVNRCVREEPGSPQHETWWALFEEWGGSGFSVSDARDFAETCCVVTNVPAGGSMTTFLSYASRGDQPTVRRIRRGLYRLRLNSDGNGPAGT